MKKQVFLLLFFLPLFLGAQVPDLYFGGGHNDAAGVQSSNNAQLYAGTETAEADRTINGQGMLAKKMEAARFLYQAGFGADQETIDSLISMGISTWLDSQFVKEASYCTGLIKDIYGQSKEIWVTNGNSAENYTSRPNHIHMNYAWWENTMTAEDILRQKVAYALSQILVISSESELNSYGVAVANYYDILIRNAFGNFYDMLYEIVMHPAMGSYLTHYNNPKTNESSNTYPDQNFAREIMQLFTIGLDSLNLDGTPALDQGGNRIPTYDNDDIIEFSKIYTGLSAGAVADYVTWTDEPYFGISFYSCKKDTFMAMYDDDHEPGEKHLLNGYIIPAGQSGMEDVEDAVLHLFDHPNVGPFISLRLIHRLVKSNPTPAYVEAVASVFNDNGSGVRGDMKEVIRTILLHPEARECTWINHPQQGKLREPFLRKVHFVNSIGILKNIHDNFWNYKYWFYIETGQHPFHSPSVFNFYTPDYVPNGAIEDAGLVAPEFQIHNSRTSVGFSRQVYRWVENLKLLQTSYYEESVYGTPDLVSLEEMAKDPDALIDHLDVLFTYGTLNDYSRAMIKDALNEFGTSATDLTRRVKLATYLIMITPEYSILK